MYYYQFTDAEHAQLIQDYQGLDQYFIQVQGFSGYWFIPESALIEAGFGEDDFLEWDYQFWTTSTMPHVIYP